MAGLQLPLQLLIASGIPLRPGEAALRAGLVLAGGLWQAALVVTSWAVSPGGQERSSVAAVYRALSAYAEERAEGPPGAGPVPPSPVFGTNVLQDPNPLLRLPDRARLRLLLDEAGRIRASLAALAGYGSRCSLLESAARVLGGLADALEARRGVRRQLELATQETLAAMDLPQNVPWRWAGADLLGQLRAAARLLSRLGDQGDEPGLAAGPAARRPREWRSGLARSCSHHRH